MRISLDNRSTRFYFLVILSLSLINGALPMLFGDGISHLFIMLAVHFVPALWFGCIIQLISNARGTSKRTLMNGTLYYGMFVMLFYGLPMLLFNIFIALLWLFPKLAKLLTEVV